MDDLSQYEYDEAYVKQNEKAMKQYELKIKLLRLDIQTIVKHLTKAETTVRLIADTYHLPEAEGYFNDTSKQS